MCGWYFLHTSYNKYLTNLFLFIFRLFTFPTRKSNPLQRNKWKDVLNRVKQDGSSWTPGKQARVCSKHFPEGQPTNANPIPTLNLGYASDRVVKKVTKPARRKLQYKSSQQASTSQQASGSQQASPSQQASGSQPASPLQQASGSQPASPSQQASGSQQASPSQQASGSQQASPEASPEETATLLLESVLSDSDNYAPPEKVSRVEKSPVSFSRLYFSSAVNDIIFKVLAELYCMIALLVVTCGFLLKEFEKQKSEIIKQKSEIIKLNCIISALHKELSKSRQRNQLLISKEARRKAKCKCNQPLYQKLLNTDSETVFYTGLETKSLFNK